ncbi:hypothetical protein ONZ43_g5083 [Nemania bipapillata]|uniref:Uncharacterized protein n=1 Tax=Nemania bipapillata TaxID=110536 RepID=A0ACC2IEX8_9PEZI|nr:hypothetical protein ONZ43_g5083 [Nemania bipapillata]
MDVGNLPRAVEAKEAKLQLKREKRLLQVEKHHKRRAEAEARQATKEATESKAEKRCKRIRLRAEELEAQAHQLLAEAQKARARADGLDKLKADKEEKSKSKSKHVIDQLQQNSEAEHDILVNASPTTDGSSMNTPIKKTRREEDEKLGDKALNQIIEREPAPSITAREQHIEAEAESKLKRKEGKRPKKRNLQQERPYKESRKKRKVEQTREDDKEEAKAEAEAEAEAEATSTRKEEKEKKKKKKDKGEHSTKDSQATGPPGSNRVPKEKNKRGKEKRTTEEDISAFPLGGTTDTNSGAQWNISHLEADTKRKQKFLRLLGGGKTNGVVSGSYTTSTSSKADIAKMQFDLEHQFDAGMKMKQEGRSHRRGLGA